MSSGYIRKEDAHRIALKYGGDCCAAKIAELPPADVMPRKREGNWTDEEVRRVYGYNVKDLAIFAHMCRLNGVTEQDLKEAAHNMSLAFNARIKVLTEEYIPRDNTVEVNVKFGFEPGQPPEMEKEE